MGRNSIPKHNAITTLGVISVSQMTNFEQLVIFMFHWISTIITSWFPGQSFGLTKCQTIRMSCTASFKSVHQRSGSKHPMICNVYKRLSWICLFSEPNRVGFISWADDFFRMRLLLASTIPCTQSFLQSTSTLTPIVTKLATWHSWFSANTRFPALVAAAAQSVFILPSLLGLCFNSRSSNCSLNEELSWWCHHRSSTTSTTSTHEGWW